MLPEKYNWIETIGPLPKLVAAALNLYGIREVPGIQNNPVIMNMAKTLKIEDIYKNDDTSWCGLFMSYLCTICEKPLPDLKGDKFNYLRAKWFQTFGNPVKKGEERFGDVGVFDRPGGGHVGLLIAQSTNTWHILGGNQGNSVNIVEIAKTRFITARNFYAIGPPESAKQYILSSSGVLSTNEA